VCINKSVVDTCSLLAEENLRSCNLEALLSSYHRYFGKLDNFRVGSALTILLQMKDLLPSPVQRIAAIFLLHELYRSDTASANPFISFFAELLQPSVDDDRAQMNLPCGHGLSAIEQWFLAQLLAPTLQREVHCRGRKKEREREITSTALPILKESRKWFICSIIPAIQEDPCHYSEHGPLQHPGSQHPVPSQLPPRLQW
jgi:hypothetical protein